jgi:hypothetical protein
MDAGRTTPGAQLTSAGRFTVKLVVKKLFLCPLLIALGRDVEGLNFFPQRIAVDS